MFSEKVDAYIAKSAPFARPILGHIRAVVHAAAPDIVEEIKWSSPFFTQNGQIVCVMRAFKAHCGLYFWKGALVVPDKSNKGEGMGQFGKLTSVEQLPSDAVLAGYVRKSLNVSKDRLQKTSSQKTRTGAGSGKGAASKAAKKKADAKKPAAKKSAAKTSVRQKTSPKK